MVAKKTLDTSHITSPRQQLMALELRTQRAVTKLDVVCDQLRELENDLNRFLEDYLNRVGPYIDELHEVESRLAEHEASHPSLLDHLFADTHNTIMQCDNAEAIETELKSLYRSMIKEYHPDTSSGSKAIDALKHEVTRAVNEAYGRRNLGELCKLKFDMEAKRKAHAMDGEDKVAHYEARYCTIDRALSDVDHRRKTLMASPAYALMQRVLEERLAGRDLVEMIIADVKGRIATQKRRIVTTKIRKLYLEAPAAETSPEPAV